MSVVTVLVVDDSPLVRRALTSLFRADPGFAVVGEAANGKEAVAQALRLSPSLITMDLDMPEMDGLAAIEEIMARAPTPILVITSHPSYRGRDARLEARARGALEILPKPAAWPCDVGAQDRLRRLARMLSTVPVVPHVADSQRKRRAAREAARGDVRGDVRRLGTGSDGLGPDAATEVRREIGLVAIGASTGGPGVLKELVEALPADFSAPIVIVQHLAEVPGREFARWLGRGARLAVHEAVAGERLEPGAAYVALRDVHVTVTPRGRLATHDEPPREGNRPSIDVLFESVARSYGGAAAGVLLTGMGRDGARGLLKLREAGGVTLAQDEATSAVFGMPRVARALGAAQLIVSRHDLADVLVHLVSGRRARA